MEVTNRVTKDIKINCLSSSFRLLDETPLIFISLVKIQESFSYQTWFFFNEKQGRETKVKLKFWLKYENLQFNDIPKSWKTGIKIVIDNRWYD